MCKRSAICFGIWLEAGLGELKVHRLTWNWEMFGHNSFVLGKEAFVCERTHFPINSLISLKVKGTIIAYSCLDCSKYFYTNTGVKIPQRIFYWRFKKSFNFYKIIIANKNYICTPVSMVRMTPDSTTNSLSTL